VSRSGGDGWWLAALPVALGAAAYSWILGVYFEGDDFVHLYDLANIGPLAFVWKGQAGHAYLVRNTVFWLTHALFGLHAAGFMATILLTHLVNVFLCQRAGARLSRDPYAASAAASMWAVAPSAAGTLGWYSVFGQVLATTALLAVLLLVSRRAADARPVTTRTVLGWLAVSWVGEFCFGTGVAVALVMPAVIALLMPSVLGRARTRWLLATGPLVVVVLYVAYQVLGERVAGVPSGAYARASFGLFGTWRSAIPVFFHLIAAGPADLFFGPLGWTDAPVAAGALALLALLVLAAGGGAEVRRQGAALALCSAAAYGMISIGRGIFGGAAIIAPRYHYLAQAPVALLLAVVVARLARGHGSLGWRRVAVLSWAALLAIVVAHRGWPAHPGDEAKRREVEEMRAAIETAVRATPAGATVYVQNRPYQAAGLLVALPQYFPRWAGLFCMLYPENAVEGRPVRFVEPDPAVRRAAAAGPRGADLLVEAAPPGAAVW